MAYKLVVTEHAHELLDKLVCYLLYRIKNEQAARHLLDGMEHIYDRLETDPFQFPICKDAYLAKSGYREAVVSQMNYIVIFDVRKNVVNIVGIFHQLEDYKAAGCEHPGCDRKKPGSHRSEAGSVRCR